MPYIQVVRSDLEEHDVSEASNHLNERAEESKEKEKEKETEKEEGKPAAATLTAQNTDAEETGEGGKEEGKEPDTHKQHSLIQAERTDDATWDVRHSARNAWCCPRLFKRVS